MAEEMLRGQAGASLQRTETTQTPSPGRVACIAIILFLLFCSLIIASAAFAQTPLKSFSYESDGCSNGLMLFYGQNYMIQPGNPPGAGDFPQGAFWIRNVSLTFTSNDNTETAVVGHSGPNGDLLSPFVIANQWGSISYPSDGAPLFSPGEYLDVHVNSNCNNNESVSLVVGYSEIN